MGEGEGKIHSSRGDVHRRGEGRPLTCISTRGEPGPSPRRGRSPPQGEGGDGGGLSEQGKELLRTGQTNTVRVEGKCQVRGVRGPKGGFKASCSVKKGGHFKERIPVVDTGEGGPAGSTRALSSTKAPRALPWIRGKGGKISENLRKGWGMVPYRSEERGGRVGFARSE